MSDDDDDDDDDVNDDECSGLRFEENCSKTHTKPSCVDSCPC